VLTYIDIHTYFSGTYLSAHTTVRNIGLVSSSLRGDTLSDDLEIEPNDSLAQTQTLTLSRTMTGYIKRTDSGWKDFQLTSNSANSDQIIGDLYKIKITPFSSNYRIDLSFPNTGADLDVYLYDSNGVQIASSTADNVGSNSYVESY